MKYHITADLTEIVYKINNAETALLDSLKSSRTKKEMRDSIRSAYQVIEECKKRLCAYRSNLEPIIPGAPDNTIETEMLGICNEIGDALYQIAKNKGKDASKILVGIRKRIQGT